MLVRDGANAPSEVLWATAIAFADSLSEVIAFKASLSPVASGSNCEGNNQVFCFATLARCQATWVAKERAYRLTR